MKAIHYEKPFQVSVREVPVPKIEHPDDAIIKVTTAGIVVIWYWGEGGMMLTIGSLAICGSDLHMYQGRTAAEGGLIFGMGALVSYRLPCTLLVDFDCLLLGFS